MAVSTHIYIASKTRPVAMRSGAGDLRKFPYTFLFSLNFWLPIFLFPFLDLFFFSSAMPVVFKDTEHNLYFLSTECYCLWDHFKWLVFLSGALNQQPNLSFQSEYASSLAFHFPAPLQSLMEMLQVFFFLFFAQRLLTWHQRTE